MCAQVFVHMWLWWLHSEFQNINKARSFLFGFLSTFMRFAPLLNNIHNKQTNRSLKQIALHNPMRSHNAKKNKINFLILLAIFVSSSECCRQNCTNSYKFGASYWQAWKRHTPKTDQLVSRFQLKRLSVTDWTVFIVFVKIKCPPKFRRPVMHFKSHSKSTYRQKETGNKKNCVLKASRKFDLHYQGCTSKNLSSSHFNQTATVCVFMRSLSSIA